MDRRNVAISLLLTLSVFALAYRLTMWDPCEKTTHPDGILHVELRLTQAKPINVLVFGAFDSSLNVSHLRKELLQ